MKNLTQLRNTLIKLYKDVESGKVPTHKANTMVNTAGKVIYSVNTQLHYRKLRGEKPDVPFAN